MKKLFLIFILTLSCSWANEAMDNKVERLKNMHTLAGAMDMIQNGFLYNNKQMIKDGAKSIYDTASSIEAKDLKHSLPEDVAYAHKFAQKMATRTKAHAKGILEAIEQNDALSAMDEYLYVMRQCTSCHLRIRKW